MPYFFSSNNLVLGKEAEILEEEARHILLSHRVKVGEELKLQGPDGNRFLVEVKEINRNRLKLLVLKAIPVPVEPKIIITLFQSIVSEKALDFIFQKGTELGLGKIVLFNSANTATKLSADGFKKKQVRWNKILMEAAKQSERVIWPSLEFVNGINATIEILSNQDKVFLTDISGQPIRNFLNLVKPSKAYSIIVGPEGGFVQEEIEQFKLLPHLETMSLGPILLRAETAALASLAILQNSL